MQFIKLILIKITKSILLNKKINQERTFYLNVEQNQFNLRD